MLAAASAQSLDLSETPFFWYTRYLPQGQGNAGVRPKTPTPSSSSNSIFSEEFRTIVKQGVEATNKATKSLNELAQQLPSVLRNLDPAMKADFATVDQMVNQVCAEIIREGGRTYGSDTLGYTPDTLKATCDYIKKVSADLVAGLDNPAIYQNYVDEMNGAVAKLNSLAAWI